MNYEAICVAAKKLAAYHDHAYTTPIHFAIVLLEIYPVAEIEALLRTALSLPPLSDALHLDLLFSDAPSETKRQSLLPEYCPATRKVLCDAEIWRVKRKDKEVESIHLLMAVMQDPQVRQIISSNRHRAMLISKTLPKNISMYTRNLSLEAALGMLPILHGYDQQVEHIIATLSCAQDANPVIVGPHGIGKNALVYGVVNHIITQSLCDFENTTFLALRPEAMGPKALDAGEFRTTLSLIVDAAKKFTNVILIIDNISQSLPNVHNSDILQSGFDANVRCILLATPAEHKSHIAPYPMFAQRLRVVKLTERTIAETIAILKEVKHVYENHHKVRISDTALVSAAKFASKYISGCLPHTAVALLDEACAMASISSAAPRLTCDACKYQHQLKLATHLPEFSKQLCATPSTVTHIHDTICVWKDMLHTTKQSEYHAKDDTSCPNDTCALKWPIVDESMVCQMVSIRTGISVSKLNQDEMSKLRALAPALRNHIFGQDTAVQAVSDAIIRLRTGLGRSNQPSSFMFLGPSGVGKTELAKALATQLFDDPKRLIRLDMSEYMERHYVAKLIGSPPGYTGSDIGGLLTNAIKAQPYSVVLFDEIEKAHVSIFDLLLQILDDGRLTDALGVHVDFSNTIIILTSNLGVSRMSQTDSDSNRVTDDVKSLMLKDVKTHFRPEFINRLDDMIVFGYLTKTHMINIVLTQIALLEQRIVDKNIKIALSPSAVNFILRMSCNNPSYGARPLKRFIEQNIVTYLSNCMLDGTLLPNMTIHVSSDDNALQYQSDASH